jgi:hypothetical protein
MLLQPPQNLVANVPIAKLNDVKVTVLKFLHLPFPQRMLSLLSPYIHINGLRRLRIAFCSRTPGLQARSLPPPRMLLRLKIIIQKINHAKHQQRQVFEIPKLGHRKFAI